MITVKELQEMIQVMPTIKLPKKLKVTTRFWRDFKSEFELDESRKGYIFSAYGFPVEIDDEIDGLYEFVY